MSSQPLTLLPFFLHSVIHAIGTASMWNSVSGRGKLDMVIYSLPFKVLVESDCISVLKSHDQADANDRRIYYAAAGN